MIKYVSGNIFDSEAKVLVNPVNCDGVMGAGLALQFKKRYPESFEIYRQACLNQQVAIGAKLLITQDEYQGVPITIVHFPTKNDWRKVSKMEYIETGLQKLKEEIIAQQWQSIAIPKIGCGIGSLEWRAVKYKIKAILSDLDANIFVYE